MKTKFEEYFYHDVLIKEISIKNDVNENAFLEFVLTNEDLISHKCIFKNAFQVSLIANLRNIGNVFIVHAFVNETDNSILEYKKNMTFFIPVNILNKIRCYIIHTTRGETIKILSEDDIFIVDG